MGAKFGIMARICVDVCCGAVWKWVRQKCERRAVNLKHSHFTRENIAVTPEMKFANVSCKKVAKFFENV
jgi:hypothetical protein